MKPYEKAYHIPCRMALHRHAGVCARGRDHRGHRESSGREQRTVGRRQCHRGERAWLGSHHGHERTVQDNDRALRAAHLLIRRVQDREDIGQGADHRQRHDERVRGERAGRNRGHGHGRTAQNQRDRRDNKR